MNYCINCAWKTKKLGMAHPYCTLPGAVVPDKVYGHSEYPLCWIARREDTKCGPEGRCWELKPTFWQKLLARFKT